MPRNTFAKKLISLANEGKVFEAHMLARYGRELTIFEHVVRLYYRAFDQLEDVAVKGKVPFGPLLKGELHRDIIPLAEFEDLQRTYHEKRDALVELFLNSVENHDDKTILAVAHAVSFLKNKRRFDGVVADRERAILLFAKLMAEKWKHKFTIREVARMVQQWQLKPGEKWVPSEDGYSSIRRKCNELGVPLKESVSKKNKP